MLETLNAKIYNLDTKSMMLQNGVIWIIGRYFFIIFKNMKMNLKKIIYKKILVWTDIF